MGVLAYSLLRVLQDLDNQPKELLVALGGSEGSVSEPFRSWSWFTVESRIA